MRKQAGAAQKWAHTMCRVDLRTGGMADGTEFLNGSHEKKTFPNACSASVATYHGLYTNTNAI
jgi:hypothetical protein